MGPGLDWLKKRSRPRRSLLSPLRASVRELPQRRRTIPRRASGTCDKQPRALVQRAPCRRRLEEAYLLRVT